MNMTEKPDEFANMSSDRILAIVTNATEFFSYKFANALQVYYQPALSVIGLVGNLLCLIIMLQKKNRKLPPCVYLTGLAITDLVTVLLYTVMWVTSVLLPEKFERRTSDIWACKI